MDSVKGFFKKKSTDRRFKKAGPGRTLGDTEASTAATASAAASTQAPRADAMEKQSKPMSAAALAAERRLQSQGERGRPKPGSSSTYDELSLDQATITAASQPTPAQTKVSPASELQVKVVCPLTGDVVREMDALEHLTEKLLELMEASPLDMSVKMIYTLCTDKEARQRCLDTLIKYLRNMLDHPDEAKFRRIRMGNKAFQERVASVLGGLEFLQAVGFEQVTEDDDTYLVFQPESLDIVDPALQLLQSDQTVRCPLYRDPRVYRVADGKSLAMRTDLPVDFYSVTYEDVRKRHQHLTSESDELQTLRTKVMREAQQNKSKRVYRFCLLRIRVNSEYVLQGIFESKDSLHSVYRFVREALSSNTPQDFVLQTQHDRSRLEDSGDITLTKAGLVPTANLVPVGASLTLNGAMMHAATQFA